MKNTTNTPEAARHLHEWRNCVTALKWQKFTLRRSAAAAIVKAMWLDLPAQDVVPVLEALCIPHDPAFNGPALWELWSTMEKQLNGTPDNQELEAA